MVYKLQHSVSAITTDIGVGAVVVFMSACVACDMRCENALARRRPAFPHLQSPRALRALFVPRKGAIMARPRGLLCHRADIVS